MASELVSYSGDFFNKASIYWHPLFPLLARTFENCHNATNGALNLLKPVSGTFKTDVRNFVNYILKSKPTYHPNKEVDSLLISCISELREHLLILEQVDHLVDTFCGNYVNNIKCNLSLGSIFGSEDPFLNFDSSSEDDDDWFNEILDGEGQKAKRPKLDSDWIHKYSNIIPDFMSENGSRCANLAIEQVGNFHGCTKAIDPTRQTDSVVEYRAATQIFQSPKVGGDGTCTAIRSVEFVVWGNESKTSFLTAPKPPKPVPNNLCGFDGFKKPTIGSTFYGRGRDELVRNSNQEQKPTAYYNKPHPIVPVPIRNSANRFESRMNDGVERAGYNDNTFEQWSTIAQTSKNNDSCNFSNTMFSSEYSDTTCLTLVTRESDKSTDVTKFATSYSSLSENCDLEPLRSESAYQTIDLTNISTTSNRQSTMNCTTGVNSYYKCVRPGSASNSEWTTTAFGPTDSLSHSSIATSKRALPTQESNTTENGNYMGSNQVENQRSLGHASKDIGTNDLNLSVSIDQSNMPRNQPMNVTYASHYQDDTTLNDKNPIEGLNDHKNEVVGDTYVVKDMDLTVNFVEGEANDTESALGSAFEDIDAVTFDKTCEALISTLEKASRVKRPLPSSNGSGRKNIDRLRPFSTPMISSGIPKKYPRDPAEQEFVHDLVKSWEPAPRRRSERNRISKTRNDSEVSKPGPGIKYPEETTAILKSWFREHISCPYPNASDISTLALATGLTKVQLKAWFSYSRQKAKKTGLLRSDVPNTDNRYQNEI